MTAPQTEARPRSVWAYLVQELPDAPPETIAAATTALIRFLNDNTSDMYAALSEVRAVTA